MDFIFIAIKEMKVKIKILNRLNCQVHFHFVLYIVLIHLLLVGGTGIPLEALICTVMDESFCCCIEFTCTVGQ